MIPEEFQRFQNLYPEIEKTIITRVKTAFWMGLLFGAMFTFLLIIAIK